ncbi:hypothetical protein [Streptomyces sp. NPDC000410]
MPPWCARDVRERLRTPWFGTAEAAGAVGLPTELPVDGAPVLGFTG